MSAHSDRLPCPARAVLCRIVVLFTSPLVRRSRRLGHARHVIEGRTPMPFRLASAQTAATEAQTRARALLDLNEISGAEMVYETLLATLDLILRQESDAQPASERTLLMITGASRRLPIDALYPARVDQLATRVG